jgi:hypothetical protein
MADKLITELRAEGLGVEMMLAALANAGMRLTEEDNPKRSSIHG